MYFGAARARLLLVGLAFLASACAHSAASRDSLADCAGGDGRACRAAADLSRAQGNSVAELQSLERGCALGDNESCFWVATMFFRGQGVTPDVAKGRAILEAPCRRGHRPSCDWPFLWSADAAKSCAQDARHIERSEVAAVAKAHRAQLHACYQATLSSWEWAEGKIVIRFSIGLDGAVLDPEIESSTLATPRVAECVRESVRGWRFPCTGSDEPLPVAYPFVFSVY